MRKNSWSAPQRKKDRCPESRRLRSANAREAPGRSRRLFFYRDTRSRADAEAQPRDRPHGHSTPCRLAKGSVRRTSTPARGSVTKLGHAVGLASTVQGSGRGIIRHSAQHRFIGLRSDPARAGQGPSTFSVCITCAELDATASTKTILAGVFMREPSFPLEPAETCHAPTASITADIAGNGFRDQSRFARRVDSKQG